MYEARDRVKGAARDAGDASEATALTVRLQNRMDFLGAVLATVVEGIEGISKAMVTGGALEALMAFGSTTMFMSFEMTAEWAFHKF